MDSKLVLIVLMIIALAMVVLFVDTDAFVSVCDDDVTFGYDPRNPDALCAYKNRSAFECGLTPARIIERCARK